MEILVKHDGNEYILKFKREPGFDELAAAYNIMMSGFSSTGSGVPNLPKAGKFIIDACADMDNSSKEFLSLDLGVKLMFSASIEAAKVVETFDAELKKN